MAVLWDESVSGDLSNFLSPTPLGTLIQGDNTITGALPEAPQDNLDVFSFVVPVGFVVEAINVTAMDLTGFQNGFNLFLSDTELISPVNTATSGIAVGANLFDNAFFGFSGPLTAGTYTFDLRGFDTTFGANAWGFNLVLLPTNNAPIANDDPASTSEDTAVVIDALGNDTDGDNEALSITRINGTTATVGSAVTLISGALVTLNADGTLNYDPNGKYEFLAQGATATETFTYTISDGRRGRAETATVTVTINGVNDAPTAVVLSNAVTSISEAASTAARIKVADIAITDVDGGTNLVSLSGVDGGLFEVVGNALYIRAGAPLDFETNPLLNVTVHVNDPAINGNAIEASTSLAISVSDALELLIGTPANNTLNGGATGEQIEGLAGNDIIRGNGGNDRIAGGLGVDIMSGGAGADVFVFRAAAESGAGYVGYINNAGLSALSGQGKRDIITDFTVGVDEIDLFAIDANTKIAGNQAFAFSAAQSFSGVAGHLIAKRYDAAGVANDKTIVYGDVNGDKKADFQIELTGLKMLAAGDFVL
jgi:VCBS repeat-containing protein